MIVIRAGPDGAPTQDRPAARAGRSRRAARRRGRDGTGRRVRLRRPAERPSLTAVANPLTPQEIRTQAGATACAGGVPPSKAFANTQSPTFQTAGTSVLAAYSATEILPSTALVAKDLAAIERPRSLQCLLAEVETGLRSSLPVAAKLSGARATRMPSVLTGIAGSFAMRFSVTVRVAAGGASSTVAVYVDDIGFAHGQAEISLAIDTTVTAPSSSLERRLAAVLVARARAELG